MFPFALGDNGALDLSLVDNHSTGTHFLYRNLLPPDRARRSLQVLVQDNRGRYTRAGSEVRLYKSGTRDLLGTRLVDTRDGYCSQSALPVHFGINHNGTVDVEVTYLTGTERKVIRIPKVDPRVMKGKPLVVRTSTSMKK